MAQFLVDEDLPRSLSTSLQQRQHIAQHVIDLGFRGAPDSRVFAMAQERQATLLSRDPEFANILLYPLGQHFGIVVVRFPSEVRSAVLVNQVVELLENVREEEFRGALIILEPGRIRIRRAS